MFFHQSVPYSNVLKLIDESGALLIAESFEEKYISLVRYSLSTKVGDSFCSMKPLICIGGVGAGAVDFVKEQHCAFVCDDPNELDSFCEALKNDFSFRAEKMASKQFKVASTLFNEAHEALLFKDIVRKYLKVRTDD